MLLVILMFKWFDPSPEFWLTVKALGLAGIAFASKHFRLFVLHFFKGVKKRTKSNKPRKP